MTKTSFIDLADWLLVVSESDFAFTAAQLEHLADFCAAQNPRFNRARWLGYIAGTNGPDGGKVK